jgi:hypothetical protein
MWQKIQCEDLFKILKQDGYKEREYISCDINDFYALFKYTKNLWFSAVEVDYSENRMTKLMDMCKERLNSFDENIKWIMLFIFSSEKHPLMMKEAQMINTLYSERVDIDLFWDFHYFNHESNSMKIYLVIGN